MSVAILAPPKSQSSVIMHTAKDDYAQLDSRDSGLADDAAGPNSRESLPEPDPPRKIPMFAWPLLALSVCPAYILCQVLEILRQGIRATVISAC